MIISSTFAVEVRIRFFFGGKASSFSLSLISPRTSMPDSKSNLNREQFYNATCRTCCKMLAGIGKGLPFETITTLSSTGGSLNSSYSNCNVKPIERDAEKTDRDRQRERERERERSWSSSSQASTNGCTALTTEPALVAGGLAWQPQAWLYILGAVSGCNCTRLEAGGGTIGLGEWRGGSNPEGICFCPGPTRIKLRICEAGA